ncbi:hypothetical protein [Amycolatopsis sp. NPDC051371]|uniref:hypothetical protein n=1 Tax=Amycolatopsis sp. NPDC051371 TaxID=3155800 RepID=UPI00343E3917
MRRWDPGHGPLSATREATKPPFGPVAAAGAADPRAGRLPEGEGAHGPRIPLAFVVAW